MAADDTCRISVESLPPVPSLLIVGLPHHQQRTHSSSFEKRPSEKGEGRIKQTRKVIECCLKSTKP